MGTKRSTSSSVIDEPAGTEPLQESPLAEAGREAGDSAGHLAERATDIGFQRVDQGREQVAEGIGQLAGTIRQVSTDLGTNQPMIADVAATAADQAERIGQYLRETDAKQIITNVEDLARRQPILFLGGAFVLGLVASRLLKAGSGGQAGGQQVYAIDGRTGSYGTYKPGATTAANGFTDEGF